ADGRAERHDDHRRRDGGRHHGRSDQTVRGGAGAAHAAGRPREGALPEHRGDAGAVTLRYTGRSGGQIVWSSIVSSGKGGRTGLSGSMNSPTGSSRSTASIFASSVFRSGSTIQ